MKKQIFALLLVIVVFNTYGQKNLRAVISGGQGLSKHFTTLDESSQIAFDPSKAKDIFGLNVSSDLVLQKAESDDLGMTHYRYSQTYKGFPVENAMYIAHTQGGRLISMSGTVVTEFDRKVEKITSALSSQEAIKSALNYVHAEKYAWNDTGYEQRIKFRKGEEASYYPVPVKVWYSGEDEINPGNLKLAYKVDVYSLRPLDRKFIFVDALSGEILGTQAILKHSDVTSNVVTGYSGSKTIHSDYTGSYYRLRDYTKGKGIITLHAVGTHADYKSSSASFNYTTGSKWALDAHYGVSSTWRFYKNNFNRNSIDNNGYALVSWVNDTSASNKDNAYWDGSEMVYGILSSNGKGVVGIDVIGHELTHGVTEYTSSLIYSKEPGAINESMSDIMGKSVQFYSKPSDSSWILSNDMGWEIRDFSNPNADGQPDTYKGTYWITSSFDNYGVHTNSGVGNFMFYLLVKGGSGTNDIGNKYAVAGIGLSKADKIIYRSNTTYLTSTSQYTDWRNACIQAATDLYGATSNEVKQVRNAWYAVGVSPTNVTYCSSKGANTTWEYINKVLLGTINNTSGNNSGYKDYTSLSTNLTAGKTYSITLTPGFSEASYSENWAVYIDYNKDLWLNGTGEIVASGSGIGAKTFSFTVPSTAKTGKTRLRIQMAYSTLQKNPCATLNFGEVEDYTVNIVTPSTVAPITSLEKESENHLTIAPNPVTGTNAVMHYQLAGEGNTTMRIIDINGRSLSHAALGYKKSGVYTYKLSTISTLPNGNYVVVLEQNGKIIERKHIIIAK
jgi:Zn-dependent metalloprotease